MSVWVKSLAKDHHGDAEFAHELVELPECRCAAPAAEHHARFNEGGRADTHHVRLQGHVTTRDQADGAPGYSSCTTTRAAAAPIVTRASSARSRTSEMPSTRKIAAMARQAQ
jgi:hypothetical protein